jgi:capsular polysaccharide transport system permease protein
MAFQAVERIKRLGGLFVACVILPTLGAILYFGFFASDVYISEARFVVRSPEKSMPSGLGILFRTTGIGGGSDEVSAAQTFLTSRDALAAMNADRFIEKSYTRPGISIFNRFDPLGYDHSFERLYRYFTDKVHVEHETASTITVLSVRAFNPDDAYTINRRLLELSETLVNRLSTRARQDVVKQAERDVEEAQKKSTEASVKLANFRNAEGVVDPERQAQIQLQMISKLQDTLIATRTQLSELRIFTPQNSQIAVLQSRARELEAEIAQQNAMVAGNRKSLSSVTQRYQRLSLDSQFAEKQLAATLASLQEARSESLRKQAYVERIAQPNRPDEAMEPRRLRGILATLVLGLVIWGVLSMLLAGVREHGA